VDPQELVVDDHDLLDEVQHQLAADAERSSVEPVLEGLGEALDFGDVHLQRARVVVLVGQQAGLLLQGGLVRGELVDVLAADLGVQPVADGPIVVLDAALEVVDSLLDRLRPPAVGLAALLDARLDTTLQLGEGVGGAQAGAQQVEDEALDPVLLDRQRGTHGRTLVEVAPAVVAHQVVGLALAVGVLLATAGEVASAVVAPDEPAEQVLDVLLLGAALGEGALGGDLPAAHEQLAVHQRLVGVLDDDLLGLGGGPPGAVVAGLAALEPHAVAHVGAVVEDVVDGGGVPVRTGGRVDAVTVEGVGDALAAHPVVRGQVEDASDDGDLLLRPGRQPGVGSLATVGDPLQPVAVGHAAAVAVAALRVLPHPLDRLGGQVHRVELVDDLDHPLVEEPLRRLRVVVLGDRLDRDAMLAQQRLEQDRLLAVAREAVEFVHQDQVHVVAPAERDHLAEARPLVRRGVGGLTLIHEPLQQGVVGAVVEPAAQGLALGGDGQVLEGLLLG